MPPARPTAARGLVMQPHICRGAVQHDRLTRLKPLQAVLVAGLAQARGKVDRIIAGSGDKAERSGLAFGVGFRRIYQG